MRCRQRRAARRFHFLTFGKTGEPAKRKGYTLIETAVSLTIFIVAAAVFSVVLEHGMASYQNQCRMELAGQMCRDVGREMENQLQGGGSFESGGEDHQILYFQDKESGDRRMLSAGDFKLEGKEKMDLELDFSGTGPKEVKAEIRIYSESGPGDEKQMLARRHLTVKDWEY